MKKIALSTFVLALGLASPVLANDTTQNGLPVMKVTSEARTDAAAAAGFDVLALSATEDRASAPKAVDAARGAYSGV